MECIISKNIGTPLRNIENEYLRYNMNYYFQHEYMYTLRTLIVLFV